jgi:hypothetical protein
MMVVNKRKRAIVNDSAQDAGVNVPAACLTWRNNTILLVSVPK